MRLREHGPQTRFSSFCGKYLFLRMHETSEKERRSEKIRYGRQDLRIPYGALPCPGSRRPFLLALPLCLRERKRHPRFQLDKRSNEILRMPEIPENASKEELDPLLNRKCDPRNYSPLPLRMIGFTALRDGRHSNEKQNQSPRLLPR